MNIPAAWNKVIKLCEHEKETELYVNNCPTGSILKVIAVINTHTEK